MTDDIRHQKSEDLVDRWATRVIRYYQSTGTLFHGHLEGLLVVPHETAALSGY